MFLSSQAKERIINVRDYYEKRDQLFDLDFLSEILAIVKREEAFRDILEYEFIGEKSRVPAYTRGRTVYFNMNVFVKYIKGMVESGFVQYPREDMAKYCNFMAQLIIFHECSHVWQLNGLEKYSEINRLYSDLWSIRSFPLKDIMKVIKIKINMLRVNEHTCYERHANIDALRELIDIYHECEFLNFIELQHINTLSYKSKGESIVHDTLHAFLLEYNYNCDGIPQDLLFEVGLPTNNEYSKSIYDAIDKYNNDELSYNQVMEKIKKY